MGFCAACKRPGDSTARVCGACRASGATRAAGAGRDADRLPEDTAVLGPFGFYQPFGELVEKFRVAEPGTGEDPYAWLYAAGWAEQRGPATLPLPPTKAEGPGARNRAGDAEATIRESPGRHRRHLQDGDRGFAVPRPYRQHKARPCALPGAVRQRGGPGRELGAVRQRGGADPYLGAVRQRSGADPCLGALPGYAWVRRPDPAVGSAKRITLAVLAVIALVAGGGGLLGYGMNRYPPPPAATPAVQGSVGQPGHGSAPRLPSPAVQPGNGTVAAAPSVAGVPAARTVVSLLTRFFRTINAHDYPAYRRLLDPKIRPQMTPATFGSGYRSTVDSGATLTRLAAMADGRAAADVMFTSHQAPADSADRSSCTNWNLTLFLDRASGGYLIGASPAGYRPSHQPCPGPAHRIPPGVSRPRGRALGG